MQKLNTNIGVVKIVKKSGKVVLLKLPDTPHLVKGRYTYEDLLNLSPDFTIGTPFQKRVWRYIRKIPYGRTVTYKMVADDLKLGNAYRAVGQACRSNPIPIVIPCHRVITSSGKPGGYSSGSNWKKFLLELEKGRI